MPKIEIKALENGPVLVPGEARVKDADGNWVERRGSSTALCRCGHSGDKPFCDGSHRQHGFQAVATEFEVESP